MPNQLKSEPAEDPQRLLKNQPFVPTGLRFICRKMNTYKSSTALVTRSKLLAGSLTGWAPLMTTIIIQSNGGHVYVQLSNFGLFDQTIQKGELHCPGHLLAFLEGRWRTWWAAAPYELWPLWSSPTIGSKD